MRKISFFILSSLLLLSVFTSAQRNGTWKLSITTFLNHNSTFRNPRLLTPSTFSFCFDCSAFQPYPTFGYGGGCLADKVYKNHLILRTGLIFTQYNFRDKISEPMANY